MRIFRLTKNWSEFKNKLKWILREINKKQSWTKREVALNRITNANTNRILVFNFRVDIIQGQSWKRASTSEELLSEIKRTILKQTTNKRIPSNLSVHWQYIHCWSVFDFGAWIFVVNFDIFGAWFLVYSKFSGLFLILHASRVLFQ